MAQNGPKATSERNIILLNIIMASIESNNINKDIYIYYRKKSTDY